MKYLTQIRSLRQKANGCIAELPGWARREVSPGSLRWGGYLQTSFLNQRLFRQMLWSSEWSNAAICGYALFLSSRLGVRYLVGQVAVGNELLYLLRVGNRLSIARGRERLASLTYAFAWIHYPKQKVTVVGETELPFGIPSTISPFPYRNVSVTLEAPTGNRTIHLIPEGGYQFGLSRTALPSILEKEPDPRPIFDPTTIGRCGDGLDRITLILIALGCYLRSHWS